MSGKQILNINEYRLVAPVADYRNAITALAAKTEAEGHPGVGQYLWFADADAGTASAMIAYADSAAWLAHHRMAYEWPEMAALQATVAMDRFTIFGALDAEVEEWINGTGLSYTHYPESVAGFVRAGASSGRSV